MADIRSFFTGGKKASTETKNNDAKKQVVERKSKDETNVKKRKDKRKRRIESDSDDEEPLPTSLRKDHAKKEANGKKRTVPERKKINIKNDDNINEVEATSASPPKKIHQPKVKQKESKLKTEVLKSTTAADYFGKSQPIVQASASASTKRKMSGKSEPSPSKHNSARKKSRSDVELDEDILVPTPPTFRKSVSLTSKLSLKAKDKEELQRKVDNAELKMKNSVQNYIEKAKDTDKKREQNKNEGLKTPVKKKTTKKETAEEVTTPVDTTPVEKKKNNYWAYKHRDGPTALGSRDLPVGAENCLEGLTFVITGILESFERETIVDCVQRYGGKITGSVSGRTSYVITGRDPGQSKIEKATKLNTKLLTEEDFLELVRTRPGKHGTASTPTTKTTKGSKQAKMSKTQQQDTIVIPDSQNSCNSLSIDDFSSPSSQVTKNRTPSSPVAPPSQSTQSPTVASQDDSCGGAYSLLWADKYKPKSMKNIVGQQGEKSNANKLKKWLLNWKTNNSTVKATTNFYSGKEDGSVFKAALLSGPPGVGKTTTATLVCKESGFTFIEMNASDTRGKKALECVIKESLSNVTVNGLLQDSADKGNHHALIMDEVDGMAGNEDRGGMQELIQLIKKSKIPIICMCNDRNHPKVRSLANYCFDLRFYKPRVDQIKGFALTIATREGLKIAPQAMERIVVGANQDIRQVVHNLQMWTATTDSLSYDDAKEHASKASKNIKVGPFDIVKQLFTESESSKLSIHEKSDLFFMDYSFVPLFVQENYLAVKPAQAGGNARKTLELISSAADSIADSNLVERLIRGEQNWSLLPLQGFLSTVVPSMQMSGYLGQRIEFPRWLGKNSSRGKHDRILQELKTHMSLSCDCAKGDINLDYLPLLKIRLKGPLLNQNIEASTAVKEVISFMNSYNLTREDWDSIMEIGTWGNESDVTSKIPTKVKSAFTRLYNKESHKTPFAVQQATKKSKGQTTASEDLLIADEDAEDADGDVDDDDVDDDIAKNPMVKIKKEPVASTSGKTKSKVAKSKPETTKRKPKKK